MVNISERLRVLAARAEDTGDSRLIAAIAEVCNVEFDDEDER